VPQWLIDVLIQYPIIVVVGLVAWYAYHKIEQNNERHAGQRDADHKAHLAALEAAYRQHLESKNQEIARLREELRSEIQAVGKKVDSLSRKLG
jgi:sensor histidine kinase regulating citrate/malate metabolism